MEAAHLLEAASWNLPINCFLEPTFSRRSLLDASRQPPRDNFLKIASSKQPPQTNFLEAPPSEPGLEHAVSQAKATSPIDLCL